MYNFSPNPSFKELIETLLGFPIILENINILLWKLQIIINLIKVFLGFDGRNNT